MGGQYLGTTRIDAEYEGQSGDAMGRDQQILIRRETIRNEQSKSIFGGNITEERSFAIHLKNEKESAISMEVIVENSVSSNPDIVVKVIGLNGGPAAAGQWQSELDGPSGARKQFDSPLQLLGAVS